MYCVLRTNPQYPYLLQMFKNDDTEEENDFLQEIFLDHYISFQIFGYYNLHQGTIDTYWYKHRG